MPKQHTYVLGLNTYDHDVSACLLRDGAIAYAIAKERITRVKHAPGFYKEVIDYCLEAEGITVVDSISLEIADNVEVGRRDPMALTSIYRDLKLNGIDALVLSSCVQMPSLAAVPIVEEQCGLPVVSASICTTHQMLQRLALKTYVPNAGSLLSGNF